MSYQDWHEAQDPIVRAVKRKFDQRSYMGFKKYGTTLSENKLELIEWLNHLQEELMDAVLYIERLKQDL